MKHIILSFTLIYSSICYSQTPPFYSTQLSGKETILELLPLDSNGFYLRTGIESGGETSNQKLLKFNSNNQLEFKKPLDNVDLLGRHSFVVSSPFCENTFVVAETKAASRTYNRAFITTIKKDGSSHSQQFETSRDQTTDIINTSKKKVEWPINNGATSNDISKVACFAGKENLYVLTAHKIANGKYKNPDNKSVKTVLYEYNPSTNKLEVFITPISFEGKYLRRDYYVEFLGNDEEFIYVAYKTQSGIQGTTSVKICQLNYKGELVKEYPVSFKPTYPLSPSVNTRQLNGSYKYIQEYYLSAPLTIQPGSPPQKHWNNHAMNGIILDMKNKLVYFYGLSASENKTSFNDIMTGNKSIYANHIYVCKINLVNNTIISTIEYPFMEKLESIGNKEMFKMAKGIATPTVFDSRIVDMSIINKSIVKASVFSETYGKTLSFLIDLEQNKVEITGRELIQSTEEQRVHSVNLINHQWEHDLQSYTFIDKTSRPTDKKNILLGFKSDSETIIAKIESNKGAKTLSLFSFPFPSSNAKVKD